MVCPMRFVVALVSMAVLIGAVGFMACGGEPAFLQEDKAKKRSWVRVRSAWLQRSSLPRCSQQEADPLRVPWATPCSSPPPPLSLSLSVSRKHCLSLSLSRFCLCLFPS
jgi:hypothetical protein